MIVLLFSGFSRPAYTAAAFITHTILKPLNALLSTRLQVIHGVDKASAKATACLSARKHADMLLSFNQAGA